MVYYLLLLLKQETENPKRKSRTLRTKTSPNRWCEKKFVFDVFFFSSLTVLNWFVRFFFLSLIIIIPTHTTRENITNGWCFPFSVSCLSLFSLFQFFYPLFNCSSRSALHRTLVLQHYMKKKEYLCMNTCGFFFFVGTPIRREQRKNEKGNLLSFLRCRPLIKIEHWPLS